MRATAALLVVAVGCSAPTPAAPGPPDPPSAPSATSSWSLPDKPGDPQPAEDPAPLAVVARYKLRARDDADRDLLAVIDALGVERVVGRVPPEHRCLAGTATGVSDRRAFVVSCGTARVATIQRQAAALEILGAVGAATTIPLASGASFRGEPGPLDDPASGQGCEKAPRRGPLVLTTAIRPDPDPSQGQGRRLALVSSELKIEFEIGKNDHSYCHGRYDPSRRTYRASCDQTWASTALLVQASGDGLFFSDEHQGYDAGGSAPLGGVRVPCGAEVRFPRLHRTTPGYSPRDGPCHGRCSIELDLCEDRCVAAPAGPFNDERGPCLDRCDLAQQACSGRCKSG